MKIFKTILCVMLLLLAFQLVCFFSVGSRTDLGIIGGADGPTAITVGKIVP